MSTGQRYSGKGNNVHPTPQTDQNTVLTPSMSDNRTSQPISSHIQTFIHNNQDLIGLPFGRIESGLQERFSQNQIRYTNVLDSLALIRAFTPPMGSVDQKGDYDEPDCHYVLLIDKKGCFDQLIQLVIEYGPDPSGDYLSLMDLTAAELLETVTYYNASAVLIVSSRNDTGSCEQFTREEQRYANDLWWDTLDKNGVKMLDWLIISPDGNGSLTQQNDSWIGRETSREGVDWYTLTIYGIQL